MAEEWTFAERHLGSSREKLDSLVEATGFDSLDALVGAVVPAGIRLDRDLDLPDALSE
ncbi:hypothetical protein BH23VER1_BH23VER1_33380 [soil metagenome]